MSLKLNSAENINWTKSFFRLISTSNYKNAHGDIGYLYDADERNLFIKALKSMQQEQPSIMNKVMYGTDWYMISKESGWDAHLDKTYNGFESTFTKPECDKIFFDNAASLFQTTPDNCTKP